MAGNVIGRRSYYRYESDDGTEYSILTDDSLTAAVGLVQNATFSAPPRRFRPRVVFCEAEVGGRIARKAILIDEVTNSNYASTVSQNITIDGLVFATTGRRGEALSFPRNSDAPDPTDVDTPTPTGP